MWREILTLFSGTSSEQMEYAKCEVIVSCFDGVWRVGRIFCRRGFLLPRSLLILFEKEKDLYYSCKKSYRAREFLVERVVRRIAKRESSPLTIFLIR